MPRSDLRAAAATYWDLGWAVLPVNGKIARIRWKQAPARHRVERLLDDPRTTGLALILGEPSGNIVARDFDAPASYERWRTQHPILAEVLPTSETPRPGHHVLARAVSPCQTTVLSDGELRSHGAYVVIPPSSHPNGQCYRWIIEPSREIPEVDPRCLIDGESQLSSSEYSLNTCNVFVDACVNQRLGQSLACVQSVPACVSPESLVEQAISQTIPRGPGERNRLVFAFARRLRGLFDPTADPETLRPYLERWHRAALPAIGTKSFDVTWADFRVAWNRVQIPAGALLGRIRQSVAEDSLAKGSGDSSLDRVARVFRAAAGVHRGRDFFLSYRTLGALAGLSHVTAHQIARRLVAEGLLEIVENGSVGRRGKATTWRWLGP
jgi:hypothetical protein